ncbi:hypothetical protein ACTMKN_10130 [Bacteroides pyogenes]|uniref:Uncharacterized protein n=2 Tax=Bacteroides pyogenes TaxID=310300 RepID=W4P799_9BACE|nr:hypothetical protein JCM6292_1997 [Bacteroides pyogenes JCM 6292]
MATNSVEEMGCDIEAVQETAPGGRYAFGDDRPSPCPRSLRSFITKPAVSVSKARRLFFKARRV